MCSNPRTSRATAGGFSLIELMVVMVIVGIATAAISLGIAPDPERELRRDAQALARSLAVAQNEVRIDGRVIAWQADSEGYRFSRGVWQTAAGSAIPVVSTAGALDTLERDDALAPRRWRNGPVSVQPARPVLLTSEAIGPAWQLELQRGEARVVVWRNASGGYEVR